MEFLRTKIPDVVEIIPKVFGDDRGYFFESFRKDLFEKNIGKIDFVQSNESKSTFGVLRGLHFQTPPFTQAKLVRVLQGKVLDVAVDIRIGSPTYGQHVGIVLDAEKKNQLWIPRGFAHGFVVLSEEAIFSYMVDNYYAPEHEGGIIWNDKDLMIDWKVSQDSIKLSEKDLKHITFRKTQFFYYI